MNQVAAILSIGRYNLMRELGRSNSVVYEAEDPASGRKVALKVLELPPTLSGTERTQRVERFQRETRAAMRMSHPNIVQTYEVGQDKDRLFVAMEFLTGKSLSRILQEQGKLSPEKATAILSQMGAALTYAHLRGVVHRDVKPSNVMILPDGQVKITDFGIARIRGDPRMTVEGQTLGTPHYMSPEQVRGQDVTSASDIFSCGSVFYEMLTGKKAFEGSNIAEIGLKIVQGEPNYPPELPRHVVAALKRALAKYPAARFATAEEFARAVLNPSFVSEMIPPQVAPPITPAAGPTAPATKPLDWTPQQSEVAWKRARIAAALITAVILWLSLPSIYREHRQIMAVKGIGRTVAAAVAAADRGDWDNALAESEKAVNLAPNGSSASRNAWNTWSRIRLQYAKWLIGNYRLSEARQQLEESAKGRGPAAEEARQLLLTLESG